MGSDQLCLWILNQMQDDRRYYRPCLEVTLKTRLDFRSKDGKTEKASWLNLLRPLLFRFRKRESPLA